MLVHGRVGLATYTPEALADPRVLELAGKVRYETKEYASYPAAFPGGVRIRLRDGRTLEADFPHQLGAPENPMSEAQVREKFRENAALAGGGFDGLEETVLALEDAAEVRGLLAPRASRRDGNGRAARDRRDRARLGRARGVPGRVRATSTRTSSRRRSSRT